MGPFSKKYPPIEKHDHMIMFFLGGIFWKNGPFFSIFPNFEPFLMIIFFEHPGLNEIYPKTMVSGQKNRKFKGQICGDIISTNFRNFEGFLESSVHLGRPQIVQDRSPFVSKTQ